MAKLVPLAPVVQKKHLGLLRGTFAIPDDFDAPLPAGFKHLGISGLHAVVAASLPHLHGDPFDRMLIAQAQAESALLLTRDDALTAYGGFVTLG